MATLIKILYSSWLANLIGGSLFTTWLVIDFNDIKMMVLGSMAMIWATGHGLISLWRQYMKGQREKIDLQEHERQHKERNSKIKSQSK